MPKQARRVYPGGREKYLKPLCDRIKEQFPGILSEEQADGGVPCRFELE